MYLLPEKQQLKYGSGYWPMSNFLEIILGHLKKSLKNRK
jgi:hypothetical protein